MTQQHEPESHSTPQLGLWDAVSIIVGIVVGVSIFKVPGQVFRHADGPWMGMAVWGLGGLASLVGALCYAELATTYPRSGGDYVYLSRGYGRWLGFLFGWAQLAVILTGSIGVMAFAFAIYCGKVFPMDKAWQPLLAVAAIVVLSLMNIVGVVLGKSVQNILSTVKVLGLAAIVVAGIAAGLFGGGTAAAAPAALKPSFGIGVAMVLVMYAFGGWNDAAFVAAEVKNPKRNLPLALVLGTLGITVVYVIVNLGFLWGLGYDRLRESDAPVADLFSHLVGPWGETAVSILVMISALGAVNGLIFTGARVYSSMGGDHRVFAPLAAKSRWGSPVWSLVAQLFIAVLLIVAVGTPSGQQFLDRCVAALGLGRFGLDALPWTSGKFDDGFDLLFSATAPVFWSFFLLTGVSVFVLRIMDSGLTRPFKVPLFPITPLVFCGFCGFMLYKSVTWAETLAIVGLAPLLMGVPLYVISALWQSASPGPSLAVESEN